MLLEKNTNLFPSVKSIKIKPVNTSNSEMKNFERIYNTPSKITFSPSTKLVNAGLEYNTKVSCLYPGLKETDFSNFHDLLQQRFITIIEFIDGRSYQISFLETPLKLSSSFQDEVGFTLTFYGKTFYKYKYVGTSEDVSQEGFSYTLSVRL